MIYFVRYWVVITGTTVGFGDYSAGLAIKHYKSKQRSIWIRDAFRYRIPTSTGAKQVSNPAQTHVTPISFMMEFSGHFDSRMFLIFYLWFIVVSMGIFLNELQSVILGGIVNS